jgi:hypothetical protein
MKSLHLKKLVGVGEKMRTWGKSESKTDSDHSSHHHHHHRHHTPPPSPSPSPLPSNERQDTTLSDGDEPATPGVLSSPRLPSRDSDDQSTHTVELDLGQTDAPLLPDLPPLPPPKRRSSVPHVMGFRRSKEIEKRGGSETSTSPDASTELLLIDDSPIHPHGHSPVRSGEKGQKLEEKIKELKLRDLALREERNKERDRRKDAERQLKAMQKERYIQGLKIKYLETKLEKVDCNKSDMEKRAKKDGQANAAMQKELEAVRARLAEREKSLAEKDEALAKAKRLYAGLKYGGTDDSSLEELEELDHLLEKSRNALLERIKHKVKEEVDDKAKCLICFDRTKAIIFVPCGHRVCCTQCSSQVKICPICRANIEIRQKVFE